jgi:hypothetical protein
VLLPQVARDGRLGARAMLEALAHKSGAKDWNGSTLFAFTTDDVVVRQDASEPEGTTTKRAGARDLAARWLAGLVARDGRVTFAVDARERRRIEVGPMYHGRAAVLVRALDVHGGHERIVARARAWLARDVAAAMRGHRVEGWPDDPAMAAGTLALAAMAGVDVEHDLASMASVDALRASPWHAAQVVAVLGPRAPDALWKACVDHLPKHPWAPWTAMAAEARDDVDARASTRMHLARSIRLRAPHAGGCATTEVPETALTAITVEALVSGRNAEERTAIDRAREFLLRRQLRSSNMPAPLDPHLALGAFVASPVADVLRCDVTAHALLALSYGSA